MESLKVFSILKNIKQHKRSSLNDELVDDLRAINVDNINIEDFNADGSINLWWKAKSRRRNQHPSKEYQKRKAISDESSPDSDSASEPSDILEDWDSWVNNLTS